MRFNYEYKLILTPMISSKTKVAEINKLNNQKLSTENLLFEAVRIQGLLAVKIKEYLQPYAQDSKGHTSLSLHKHIANHCVDLMITFVSIAEMEDADIEIKNKLIKDESLQQAIISLNTDIHVLSALVQHDRKDKTYKESIARNCSLACDTLSYICRLVNKNLEYEFNVKVDRIIRNKTREMQLV